MTNCKFDKLAAFVECASNAVPKVSTLKQFAKTISQMGYNRIYLGTADTYKIEGERYFGYMRGGYTTAELCKLDEFCKSVGIELTPAIQTLAHLHFAPNYYEYSDIVDNGNILLVDEEKTYALIDKMFSAMADGYTSRTIHIGMDEAFSLGLGKYLKKHGYTEKKELMLRHLNRVVEIAKKYGFTCQMWSDMFFHLLTGERYDGIEVTEEIRNMIPSGVELVYWNYLTEDYKKCSEVLASHKKMSDKVSYAGAIWKFIGFAPDNQFSINICKPAMDACVENNIKTFIVTLWADNGSEASLFSALPGLYYYSEYAKGKEGNIDKQIFAEITGVAFDDFMLLDLPNKPDKDKEYKCLSNKCFMFLYNDLLYGTLDSLISSGIGEKYSESAKRLDKVKGGEFAYVFSTLSKLCSVLAVKAELPKRIRAAYEKSDRATLLDIASNDIPLYIKRLEQFFAAFKVQWLRENKEFGFETQCARIGGLIQRAKYVRERICDYLSGAVERIEALCEIQQPFGFDKQASEDSYTLMSWSKIVSNGFI